MWPSTFGSGAGIDEPEDPQPRAPNSTRSLQNSNTGLSNYVHAISAAKSKVCHCILDAKYPRHYGLGLSLWALCPVAEMVQKFALHYRERGLLARRYMGAQPRPTLARDCAPEVLDRRGPEGDPAGTKQPGCARAEIRCGDRRGPRGNARQGTARGPRKAEDYLDRCQGRRHGQPLVRHLSRGHARASVPGIARANAAAPQLALFPVLGSGASRNAEVRHSFLGRP